MGDVIVGREVELAAAERFLDAVRDGTASLLIEGSAGIGKTTLWQGALRRASDRGMRVLSSRPGASEARLTYAGLLDLLGSVDEEVFAQLPAPQRRALDVALLRIDPEGPSADQRSIATGFLAVIRTLSISGPVLVAVDDIQWLDVPSWHVLEFAMRRLENERIGLLVATRIDDDTPMRSAFGQALPKARTRQIWLGPLNIAALHEILRGELGHSFARPTLVRIERASAGNPFFALELARAIVESGEPSPASAALAMPDDLVGLLTRRLRRLPAATQRALLVASALSQPAIELLDAKAIARAEAAGVVRIDEKGRVAFAHPLLASAVYGSAPVGRRRDVHRELAGRVASAEERARHLALATDGPDENVAAALVEAAKSARGRGAPDAAIELIDLACELTPDDERDALFARKLDLGRSLSGAGDPRRAKSVLRELVATAPPGHVRARALLLLGFLSEWADGSVVATGICEQALLAAGDDVELRAEIHAAASRVCDHDAERKQRHARAALDLTGSATVDGRLRAYALLAFAEAEFKSGGGIVDAVFKEAAQLETTDRSGDAAAPPERFSHTVHLYSDVRPSARLLGILRLYADELALARADFERDRRVAAEHGDESQVARALGRLATVELRAGNWDLAEGQMTEMTSVAERTEERVLAHRGLTLRAELATLRGRLANARKLANEAVSTALAEAWPWETAQSYSTLGFLELTVGNVGAAREALDRVDESYRGCGFREPGLFRHQADHAEALIAVGDLASAREALERFEEQGRSLGRPWALATAARCRGLLRSAVGDLNGALGALEMACAEHDRVGIPFELARTLLAKGQIHRRRREKLLARDTLTRSLEIFQRLGSPMWAERARGELRRVGLRTSEPDELTVTEERVASLAASGLTNRAIAERAFLSPKTVEANLARIYQKLGIHSRAELGRAVAQRERAPAK